ncbi:hypothetical protein HDF24_09115 [Mucilaginibacter sp. X4EP1]|uniref:Ig-like domain-containing protein n=1 Tax=Mucilaginibacter sp. X4EP1 TaxID=2723092 RepID=UPI0021698567|nr:Ig-like domain-containing protein [Mucilaginibacter sp. X4EP1]MCS3813832.1 hypothetical protein [Mucilaginibacter sp. X4EP1]
MKKVASILILGFFIFGKAIAQHSNSLIVTTDIDNFWIAFDKITTTKDSAAQYDYLNKLFIDKGTPGLKAMMQVKDYTSKSYIDAINNYPLFWNSIRANTLKASGFSNEIATNVARLKALYPALKPAKVYFTIGALKSVGTTLDSMVLIGSEIALADEHTVADELPANFKQLKNFFKSDPINIVVFTNVHEYVHTQQKTTIGNNLLAQSVLEGVAEFMAEKATNQHSTLPAVIYGESHEDSVKQVFATQMFNSSPGFWLYNNDENEFGVRDMGYYVGYAICKDYYNHANDKEQAIKEMIELNYNDESALDNFVNQSGYFEKTVDVYKSEYEANRPTVVSIKQFKNNAADVNPGVSQITIEFSSPMNKLFRNFELGPLGVNNLLKIKRFIGFSDDGKMATFEVELKSNQRYQIVIGDGFRNVSGIRLKPYLINFSTGSSQ